jgi:hypothetical protein
MVGSARITHGWPRPAGHGAIPIRTDPPKKKAQRGCAVGLHGELTSSELSVRAPEKLTEPRPTPSFYTRLCIACR